MAVVIVGCPDPEQALSREYGESCGENVWGPYTRKRAHEVAAEVEAAWMDAIAEQGVEAFVYGPPHVRVEDCLMTTRPTDDIVLIAREAARNWYREAE
jgi:hypothetical protein